LSSRITLCYTDAMLLSFVYHIPLPGYQTLLVVGVACALALALLLGHEQGLAALVTVDAALTAGMGGLLLGRALYVLAHWPYFRDHLLEGLQFWHGGLSSTGAVMGGILAVLVLCHVQGRSHHTLLDLLAPAAALFSILAWLGCMSTGCAYGLETRPDQSFLWSISAELPDLRGLRAPRVAVQALGAWWSTLTLATLMKFRHTGRTFPLWLMLHAMGNVGLGFLRQDLEPALAGLAPTQWANLALTLLAVSLLLFSNPPPEELCWR